METLEFVYLLLRFWIIVRLFCGVAEKCLFFLCCGALRETRSGGDTSGIVVKGHQLPNLSHAKFQERSNQLHLLGQWLFRKYPPISSYSVLVGETVSKRWAHMTHKVSVSITAHQSISISLPSRMTL